MEQLIPQIIKTGDVEGCCTDTAPPAPARCGTTCGQDRMRGRIGQKIVNGVDASAGEIGWQVRFEAV